jgi:hypothetical protein
VQRLEKTFQFDPAKIPGTYFDAASGRTSTFIADGTGTSSEFGSFTWSVASGVLLIDAPGLFKNAVYSLAGTVSDAAAGYQTIVFCGKDMQPDGKLVGLFRGVLNRVTGGGSFSQADLTGTWDMMEFRTNLSPPLSGWFRLVVRFDGNGHMIVDDNTTYQSSVPGAVFPNGDTGMIWTVDPVGAISKTAGMPALSSFHANMASNKQLVVGTYFTGGSITDKAIVILRKRGVPGVTYGIEDLANKNFVFHQIERGAAVGGFIGWSRGTGNIDSTGQVRLTSGFENSLPFDPPVNPDNVVGKFQVDGNGIVSDTSGVQPQLKGFLTPDKTTAFFVNTFVDELSTSYELLVVSLVNPAKTFLPSDMEGTFRFHSIFVGNLSTTNGWAYGTLVVGTGGAANITGSSSNGPISKTDSITLGSDGTFGIAGNTTLHGTLSSTGNLWIATATQQFTGGFPEYDLLIGTR